MTDPIGPFETAEEAAAHPSVRAIYDAMRASPVRGVMADLGYRLLDSAGRDLPRGGAALARLERIDPAGFDRGWHSVSVKVACDVTNPLTGPEGASAVYGPQKGADAQMVRELDAALANFADVIERDLGKAVNAVDELQLDADKQSDLVAHGAGNLHEVAISLEKADVAMRLAMKVRNKVVDAYNEIMRMSV